MHVIASQTTHCPLEEGQKDAFLKPNEICLRNRQDYVVCLPSQLLRVI